MNQTWWQWKYKHRKSLKASSGNKVSHILKLSSLIFLFSDIQQNLTSLFEKQYKGDLSRADKLIREQMDILKVSYTDLYFQIINCHSFVSLCGNLHAFYQWKTFGGFKQCSKFTGLEQNLSFGHHNVDTLLNLAVLYFFCWCMKHISMAFLHKDIQFYIFLMNLNKT